MSRVKIIESYNKFYLFHESKWIVNHMFLTNIISMEYKSMLTDSQLAVMEAKPFELKSTLIKFPKEKKLHIIYIL